MALALPASPAMAATPVCTAYTTTSNPPAPNGNYPYNGHAFTCFTGFSQATANSMFNEVQALFPTGNHYDAKTNLAAAPANFFYFKNRDDNNAYFAAISPWNQNITDGVFQTTTAVCANTGYNPGMGGLTVALESSIFDQCSLKSGQGPNPDFPKTFSHELGHAYDFALTFMKGNVVKTLSQSVGWNTVVAAKQQTVNGMLLGGDLWNVNGSMYAACGPANQDIFNNSAPSEVEISLVNPVPNKGPVCTANNTLNPYYSGTTQKVILTATPYLANPNPATLKYLEYFAEIFSYENGYGGSLELPVTDHMISTAMNCSRFVMNTLLTFGKLPDEAGQIYPAGCLNPGDAAYGLKN